MTAPVPPSAEIDAPCAACPWLSKDARDREAVETPEVRSALAAGQWFCCHVNMGTCHGAERVRRSMDREPRVTSPGQGDRS